VIGEWADQADEGNTSIVTAQYVTIGGAFDFSEPRRHFPGCCFPAGHVPVDIRKRQGSFNARRRMKRNPAGPIICPFRPSGG
jgi:hypothetical protein